MSIKRAVLISCVTFALFQKEKYDEEVKLQQQQMIERQKLARMQKAKNEAAHQWQKTLAAPEARK